MKIELKIGTDDEECAIHELYINDAEVLHIQSLSDCPEDAIIERDLISGDDIISYIKLGHDAAKNGEELEIIYSELSEE